MVKAYLFIPQEIALHNVELHLILREKEIVSRRAP